MKDCIRKGVEYRKCLNRTPLNLIHNHSCDYGFDFLFIYFLNAVVSTSMLMESLSMIPFRIDVP